MSGVYWAQQQPKKIKRDEFGFIVYDDNGVPIEETIYFKTKDGDLIEVPGNGFVVRSQNQKDFALTKEEFTAQFEQYRFPGNHGYPFGRPTRWRRYKRR